MMLAATVTDGILAFFFAIVALLLMIVILLQRGRGVGLAGAFGGIGGHTAFGAKTGDFLTWVTIVAAGILLLFAVLLNFVFVQKKPDLGPATPAGTPTTPAPPTPSGESGQLWPAAPDAWATSAGAPIFGESAS